MGLGSTSPGWWMPSSRRAWAVARRGIRFGIALRPSRERRRASGAVSARDVLQSGPRAQRRPKTLRCKHCKGKKEGRESSEVRPRLSTRYARAKPFEVEVSETRRSVRATWGCARCDVTLQPQPRRRAARVGSSGPSDQQKRLLDQPFPSSSFCLPRSRRLVLLVAFISSPPLPPPRPSCALHASRRQDDAV